MSSQTAANIALLRDALAAISDRDIDACERVMVEDFIINIAGAPTRRGRGTWRQGVEMMLGAFSDLNADIEDIFASDDRVAVRVTFRGTHTGDFLGIPATGREVTYSSFEHYRVADGKIAEEWICSDMASLMRQLTDAPAAG